MMTQPQSLPLARLLTVAEVAEALNIGQSTTRAIIARGEIKATRTGGIRVHPDVLREYINRVTYGS
jgi:excisionase family DNA binding protein